jgi:hypothetical protein
MSQTTDADRRAKRADARRERALAIIRELMLIVRADADDLNPEQTERFLAMHLSEFALPVEQEPLGRRRTTIWRMRWFLGLETGRAWQRTGKRTGRLGSKQALLEVRP